MKLFALSLFSSLLLFSGSLLHAQNEQAPLTEVFEQAQLDENPEPIKRVQPKYPYSMKRLKRNAKVRVEFVIDIDGTVLNPIMVESSNPRFNQSALDAIVQWKFKPGIKDGVPVRAKVAIPFAYTLRR